MTLPKNIRALRMPSIKNEATGQTWLEYYIEQIVIPRTELKSL